MMNDQIWEQVRAFKPSYFPIYQRVFYLLIIWKKQYLLFSYATLIEKLKTIKRK